MSTSDDPGHFFQSAAALDNASRKSEKAKNKKGNPVKLPSKILAITTDITSPKLTSAVFVAEAAGLVKRIDLEKRQITHIFRPSSTALAPITCLAVSADTDGPCLFAGSWDKAIYKWSLTNLSIDNAQLQPQPSEACLTGHSDFVKALVSFSIDGRRLLVSGSADASIIVWDIDSSRRLHTLKGHSRGLECLAIDPLSRLVTNPSSEVAIYSGDSTREIRAWLISPIVAAEMVIPQPQAQSIKTANKHSLVGTNSSFDPLLVHETSIYALRFAPESGDLWTASADKTSKGLSYDCHHPNPKDMFWEIDTELGHPDFVRDVLVDDEAGYVVTACRDEGVRVWNLASGELIHCYDGHYEEVTGLALVSIPPKTEDGEGQKRRKMKMVVSVSIDGTVRTWSLEPEELKNAREEALKEMSGAASAPVIEEVKKESMLTEDEERELAELMDSDDD